MLLNEGSAAGRSPRGERGLKSFCIPYDIYNLFGRSPRGERGLKCINEFGGMSTTRGRSPRGERGLKYSFLSVMMKELFVALLAESVD